MKIKRNPGGLAEKKGVTEKDVDAKQLTMGIKVELEHTKDEAHAAAIALDHLAEMPDYYTRLKQMEQEAETKKSGMGDEEEEDPTPTGAAATKAQEALVDFFKEHPSPTDKDFHVLAEDLGVNVHWLEAQAYRLAGAHVGMKKSGINGPNATLETARPPTLEKSGIDLLGDYLEKAGKESANTAISRGGLSRPLKLAMGKGDSVFDYGEGRGKDVAALKAKGISASGWDPNHSPGSPKKSADVVNLGYVINTISDEGERAQALKGAYRLARKALVVSARTDGSGSGKTSTGTYQHYYTQDGLKSYIKSVLGKEPQALGPGIFAVSKGANTMTDEAQKSGLQGLGDYLVKAKTSCPNPGMKQRSGGAGQGMARGEGRGPMGVPVNKADDGKPGESLGETSTAELKATYQDLESRIKAKPEDKALQSRHDAILAELKKRGAYKTEQEAHMDKCGMKKSGLDGLEDYLTKGGPYVGPKGGKWADPEHKIPYKEGGEGGDKVSRKLGVVTIHAVKGKKGGWHAKIEGKGGQTLPGMSGDSAKEALDKTEKLWRGSGGSEGGADAKGAQKSLTGLDGIEDYLAKSLPTTQAGADGGKLAGQGKTGAPPQSKGDQGEAALKEIQKREKLSEDDQDEEKQMVDHKKPIERIKKSAVGHHPYSMAAVFAGTDDDCAELVKSEDNGFYTDRAPGSAEPVSILGQSVLCKSCGHEHSAALTACPDCGHGGVSPSTILELDYQPPGLRLRKSEPDIYHGGDE